MEQLKKLAVPFKLGPETKIGGTLRTSLRRRLTGLSEAYAKEAAAMRREFKQLELPESNGVYLDYEKQVRSERSGALTSRYDADVPLALWKLDNNYRMAKTHNNPYLIREDILIYPCMNYMTGEGPYTPGHKDLLTGFDNHCVIAAQGQLWLIFKMTMFDAVRQVERL